MPIEPKPWFWKLKGLWVVNIARKRHYLGSERDEAFRRFYELMNQPQKRAIPSDSILTLIDSFLEFCHENRAPDTYNWYRFRLELFARRYPSLRAREIRPFHVQKWLDSMDTSSGTKRCYGRSIKRCMRWSKQQGYIDSNPIEDMQLPPGGKREQLVSGVEYSDILGNIRDDSFRDLVVTTWEVGCRPQESLKLEARHVDLANQRWVIPESEAKNDLRVVYLTPEAIEITQRLCLKYPTGPLFRNTKGKAWASESVNCAFIRLQWRIGQQRLEPKVASKDKRKKHLFVTDAEAKKFADTLSPLKQNGVRKNDAELMHEARKKLTQKLATEACPKYSLYALRHTWMNRLLTSGVDSLTVAFLAGHKDPSTLAKVYAHLSQNPQYLRDQLARAS